MCHIGHQSWEQGGCMRHIPTSTMGAGGLYAPHSLLNHGSRGCMRHLPPSHHGRKGGCMCHIPLSPMGAGGCMCHIPSSHTLGIPT